MGNNNELNEIERELIAVGASIAAGCQPCTEYHVKAARAAGACDKGIVLAVETALSGRDSATRTMGEWAVQFQGSRPEADTEFRVQKRLVVELTLVAAAAAVNSVPNLQKHLAAARQSGARPDQIRYAIDMARRIKRAAEQKIEAITSKLDEAVQSTAPATSESRCCGSQPAGRLGPAVETKTDCGCRSTP